MGATSWAFLIVGSFAAAGAAMALGTLAALLRYHRTGTFPGSLEADAPSSRTLASLWIRVAVGVVLTVIGVISLQRAGLW